ncbi:MAG: tyrosine-protein phosphatase [Actinomycetota bacterium]
MSRGSDVDDGRRAVTLDGTMNTRDIGGYHAADGRAVRWGRVYRSDRLNELSDADVDRLQALGLAVIIDMRSSFETQHAPDRAVPGVEIRLHPVDDATLSPESFLTPILAGELGRPEAWARLVEAYRTTLTSGANAFRALFEAVAAGDPVLFHCAGGKDRAGIGAALLLDVLGVDRTDITADYMLTNDRYAQGENPFRSMIESFDDHLQDVMLLLLRAEAEFIHATFDAIDELGGVEAYLTEVAGVSAETIATVRRVLLD